MGRLDRFKKEASYTAGAKVMSVLFIIGVVLLLVAKPTGTEVDNANASTPVFALGPAR